MITASGSSRLTAEATPVPSASIARSISFSASSSPWSSARSQMPLVSRGLSCFSISLKRSVLCALFVLAARLGFHRRAAGVGLHAAPAPAGALGAAALDDHVADLAGGAAAEPGLAVEDRPPPTPVPQKTPIRLWNSRPAPRWNSASVATWTSLPIRTSAPERLRSASRRAGSCPPSRAGCGRRRRRRSSRRRRRASRPRRPAGRSVSTPACCGRLAQRRRHRRRRRPAGRRWSASAAALRRAPCRRRRRSPSGSWSRRGRCRRAGISSRDCASLSPSAGRS